MASDLVLGDAAITSPAFDIEIKDMAGSAVCLRVTAETAVGDVKRRVHEQWRDFVVRLQVLTELHADGKFTILDRNEGTLGSFGVASERTLCVVVRHGFRGGEFVSKFGSHGSGTGQFDGPWGICVSLDGESLFVVDRGNHCVHVFNLRAPHYAHVRTIGSEGHSSDGQFFFPSNVCLSNDGAFLFVADTYNHRVQVLCASDGSHVRTIGLGSRGQGADQFDNPRGLCTSPDGEHLFVCDQGNNRVQVLRLSDGAHVHSIGSYGRGPGHFNIVRGLCVSPNGELLFIADSANNQVDEFLAANGKHVRTIGAEGSGVHQFSQPHDVCVSPSGEWLFVADRDNHRVQVMSASTGESVHTIGSQGSAAGQFRYPQGVSLSSDGSLLFVTDSGNNRVQVFTA